MKILVLGSDGYIGYPLTLHLLNRGHEVFGIDNYSRRKRVNFVDSDSLTPIATVMDRRIYLRSLKGFVDQVNLSLGVDSFSFIASILRSFKPNTIIHLAEQPSAPWSMSYLERAAITQQENVIGTLHLLWAMKQECPKAHLVKLGTMGEYGTPNCDIPEGEIPLTCIGSHKYESMKDACPMRGLPFPKSPGSFYHLSKVHDTHNIIFACKTWGLTSTDIMQGVVFGLAAQENTFSDKKLTRFDYDQYFGTVINRFCTQAIAGIPLTVYGKGNQKRGFLTLDDSILCLTLAIENNTPEQGEYRTFNQFENVYSINELAKLVRNGASLLRLNPSIQTLENPRTESENHYYNPTHQKLFDLGYKPNTNIQREITSLIRQLLPYKDRINKDVIMPTTTWR